MTDLLEDVGEIGEICGRSYGTPDGIDEDDLDAEMACLENEFEAGRRCLYIYPGPARPQAIPSAPQSGMPVHLPPAPQQQPSQQQTAPPTVIPAYLERSDMRSASQLAISSIHSMTAVYEL